MEFEWMGIVGLFVGCVLRTLLPYVLVGLSEIKEGGWKAWPKFEPSYLSAFGAAMIAYVVTLVTVPGAWGTLQSMSFVLAAALAYAGHDLAREVIKVFRRGKI